MGLGMFVYVEWWWNYVESRSGGRFMLDLGFRNFCFVCNFEIQIWGFQAVLRVVWGWACFSMLNGGGIMSRFGPGVDLRWIWGFENSSCL